MTRLDPSKLSPGLAAWCRQGSADEQKSVLLRPKFSVGQEQVAQDLRQLGVGIESLGKGAVSIVVSPENLAQLSHMDWVVRVDEPRTLFWKSP